MPTDNEDNAPGVDNVVKLRARDAARDPDNVLEDAMGVYTGVFIMGWNKDGEFEVRATSNLKGKDMLWLLEVFKKGLIDGDYDDAIKDNGG